MIELVGGTMRRPFESHSVEGGHGNGKYDILSERFGRFTSKLVHCLYITLLHPTAGLSSIFVTSLNIIIRKKVAYPTEGWNSVIFLYSTGLFTNHSDKVIGQDTGLKLKCLRRSLFRCKFINIIIKSIERFSFIYWSVY